MVSHVKQKIQAELPSYYGEMTEQMGRCRERVYRAVETAAGRKRAFALLMQYGDTHEGRIPREVVDSVIDQVNRENTGSKKIIRIGTRGSRLALAQAQMVKDALTGRYPEYTVETVILRTEGDKRLDQPLPAFGGKGVFVTAFEEALAQGSIDLAVHSAKDMPMELAEGMTIAGVLPRGDVRDVLVLKQGKTLSAPLVIGTGSLRRQAQLKELYPQMQCVSIRGNVPTRLQKVRDGILDGVVLAAAGLERLALTGEPEFSYLFLPCDGMLPAGGQGIIAVEGRKEDRISKLAEGISDALTLRELEAERAMMRRLNAGCHEAVGVLAKTEADGEGQQISLQVFRGQDGRLCRVSGKESAAAWPALVEKLARQLEEEQHG
jgi:hydroxymethylbilane synthase